MTRYLVGIDLGTSNTVVAYAQEGEDNIRLLPIDQLVGPGEIATRPLLPSVRYQAAAGELDPASLRLPWASNEDTYPPLIGHYARMLGTQVPGRLVSSAKSWLSHPGVDRSAPILPWGAGDDVEKISPLTASAGYLAHVHAVWNSRFPDSPLAEQDIVLTIPASFDEGARALTLEAARLAELPKLHLIEEPQAAFQDWLHRHRNSLATELADSKLVLVCDVGGGTTDLTLIKVETGDDGEAPRLTRIGVGNHLMLGGDNMDLALAHLVERRLGGTERLSAARFAQLVQRSRVAKEQLLASGAPDHVTVTLVGEGSRLVGAARSVQLGREEVERLIVDGFFPLGAVTDRPQRRHAGLVEFGLPYPSDPAITHHLAAFLQRHADVARTALGLEGYDASKPPIPDTLLLNGGVFRAGSLATRIEATLERWRGGRLRVLHNDTPDVAVAHGAVAYRLARTDGTGPSIGGGSARSYFLLLDDLGSGRAICILPRGSEAGQEIHLPDRNFALRLGQAVRFHIVSSTSDTQWHAGELIALANEDFVRLPPIATALPAPQSGQRTDVTVQLIASMTEVGTLEMHCVSTADPNRRWLLAFQLRGDADEASQEGHTEPFAPSPQLTDALHLIDRVFGSQAQQLDPKEVRSLRIRLERRLGPRDNWDLPLLRALFDALIERSNRRRRSAEHERTWLNLAGYCLRPGTGAPLDEWRIEQLFSLFGQGIQYQQESRNWSEWWTLWRRAAGGLPEAAQLQILEVLAGHLEEVDTGKRTRATVQSSYDDMVRLAASLERVPAMHRIEVGKWLLERLQRPTEKAHTWWALGRVGARESMYGSAHTVVPADIATGWIEALLALNWKQVEPAAFAATQIARLTGDRSRDLAAELRDKVVSRLTAIRAPQGWIAMVRDGAQLDDADLRRSFGESLPAGLRLISA